MIRNIGLSLALLDGIALRGRRYNPEMIALAAATLSLSLQSAGLTSYVGLDLRWGRRGDEKVIAQFSRDLAKLTGQPPPDNDAFFAYAPWWVKPYKFGRIAWVCMCASAPMMIPSRHACLLYTFDSDWHLIKSFKFSTGYRMSLISGKVFDESPLNQPILQLNLSSQGPFFGESGEKPVPMNAPASGVIQVYALGDDACQLVRYVSGDGQIARAATGWQPDVIGPDVSTRSANDWKRMLISDSHVAQLESMVWLCGAKGLEIYAKDKDQSPDNNAWRQGVERQWAKFRQLSGDEAVKRSISSLRGSSNRWVKQQGEFTWKVLYSAEGDEGSVHRNNSLF